MVTLVVWVLVQVLETPAFVLIAFEYMIDQNFSSALTEATDVQNFCLKFLYVRHFCQISFHILRESFDSYLEIRLIVFKDEGLVVPLQIISERIGIHKGLPAFAESGECVCEELDLNPSHVPELELIHFGLHFSELFLL